MLAWSRSLSPIRKALGFLDDDGEQSEDLIDVGDEDDGGNWRCVRVLTYRWTRHEGYRLKYISLPDTMGGESSADDGRGTHRLEVGDVGFAIDQEQVWGPCRAGTLPSH